MAIFSDRAAEPNKKLVPVDQQAFYKQQVENEHPE